MTEMVLGIVSVDSVEHPLLHAVLRLDAEYVPYPHSGYVYGEAGEDEHSHDAHGPVDGAFHGV